MAGAALIGFLAGSGLWLTVITLLIIGAIFSRIIDALAYLIFLYRQRYPIRQHKVTTIFRITILTSFTLFWIILSLASHFTK